MLLIYLLAAGGACSFSIVAFWLYRTFRTRSLLFWPPDFPPLGKSGVRLPKPRPGSSGAAEARAEVEGSDLSIVP
ncbi:MAG TPA: hypothetical protein DDZ80_05595 [Cyanobacteria bacterium UBA8803]|nr:hypothetical protein [Cyanobacteria bacterium UBA9273]HBL58011.1 hypothetical protein [Cyanobacteria bacterium UBA8803]